MTTPITTPTGLVTPMDRDGTINFIDVDPEFAKVLLQYNVGNRRLDPVRVKIYAAAMKDGRWRLNGETIKIANTQRLLDGQNRLHAVIAANVTVRMVVVMGLPEDVMDTIDRGKPRSVGDILDTRGLVVPNVNAVGATATLLLNLDQEIPALVTKDNELVADYVEAHLDELVDWNRFGHILSADSPRVPARRGERRSIGQSVVAALLVHMDRAGADEETLKGFFTGVSKGFSMDREALNTLSPARLSVLQLLNRRLTRGTTLTRTGNTGGKGSSLLDEYTVYIWAYNRYVSNQLTHQVKKPVVRPSHLQDLPEVETGIVR